MNESDIKTAIRKVATPHSEIPDDVSLTPAEVLHHIDLESVDNETLWAIAEAALSQYDPEE